MSLNWLTHRTAGILFKLQQTPVSSELYGGPLAKSFGNKLYSHTRQYAPGWPAKSVKKIHGTSTFPRVNVLRLETTSTHNWNAVTQLYSVGDFINTHYEPIAIEVFASCDWVGGDDHVYEGGSYWLNLFTGTTYVDGTLKDVYEIKKVTLTRDSNGNPIGTITSSYPVYAPDTAGAPHVLNGGGTEEGFFSEEKNSAYASFDGDPMTSSYFLDSYTPGTWTSGTYTFYPRHPDDPKHGFASYIKGQDIVADPFPYYYHQHFHTNLDPVPDVTAWNGVFSYEPLNEEDEKERADGINQRDRTTCQWTYQPDACVDCWYKDAKVTVKIRYKKLKIQKTVTAPTTSTWSTVTQTSYGWQDHDTVTMELTLPGGLTKQNINASFQVPVITGYIVAIDDIELVSVA